MVEERLTLTLTGWFGGWKGRTLGLRVSTSDRKRLFLDRRLKNRLQCKGLDMVLPEGGRRRHYRKRHSITVVLE